MRLPTEVVVARLRNFTHELAPDPAATMTLKDRRTLKDDADAMLKYVARTSGFKDVDAMMTEILTIFA